MNPPASSAGRHRIALAGFLHESNTFSPLRTDRAAFAAQCLSLGPGWVGEWRDAHHEVGGFLEAADREGFEPVPLALAKPPVLVNIMVHDTSEEPLRSLLAEARALEERPGILAVSLLPGFAYADVPQMGPSVVVVADGDAGLARREADRLAARLWEA